MLSLPTGDDGMLEEWKNVDLHVGEQREFLNRFVQCVDAVDVPDTVVRHAAGDAPYLAHDSVADELMRLRVFARAKIGFLGIGQVSRQRDRRERSIRRQDTDPE